MGIKQINASYVADQDRLLLRVSTAEDQEYRLWLTRAVVLKFLAISDLAVVTALAQQHPVEQAKMIAEFQQEAIAEQETFEQPFESVPELPLGSEPQLVISIAASLADQTCHLALQLGSHQTLTLHLGRDLLQKTKLLIQKISAQAQWLIGPVLPLGEQHASAESGAAKTDTSKIVH